MSPAAAADHLIRKVRHGVAADLEHAALFGSRARGDARPDSDYDILFVFRDLPPDREPYATEAENHAAAVARMYDLPFNAWSVSIGDFDRGRRTPMLVDALEDAVSLWSRRWRLPKLLFTPDDALFCTRALLDRAAEGRAEYLDLLDHGDFGGAAARAREDVTRLCTAGLLMRGITRPRRKEAVQAYVAAEGGARTLPREIARLCQWALEEEGRATAGFDATSIRMAIDDLAAEIGRRRALLKASH